MANSRLSFLSPSVFQDLETASHQQFFLTPCRIHSTPRLGFMSTGTNRGLGSGSPKLEFSELPLPWDEVVPQLTFWSLALFPHLSHHPEYSCPETCMQGLQASSALRTRTPSLRLMRTTHSCGRSQRIHVGAAEGQEIGQSRAVLRQQDPEDTSTMCPCFGSWFEK